MINKISVKSNLIVFLTLLNMLLLFRPQTLYSQDIIYDCPSGTTLKTDTFLDYTVYSCITGNTLQGAATGYYKDGKVKFVNHWEKGKAVGTWKEWDKNGNLYSVTAYKNGLKNGLETFFFANGNQRVSTTFSNGVKNGRVDEWNEDGIHLLEGNFKNGLEDGLWFIRINENKIVAMQFQKGKKLIEREQVLKGKHLPKVKYN